MAEVKTRGLTRLGYACAFAWLLTTGCRSKEAVAPTSVTPPEVEVTPVVQKNVPIIQEWVANVDGFVNAQIQPQVSGYLLKQTYREGSFVEKGQSLFEIDARPFQAALQQAQAQLAESKAQEFKAQEDVNRDGPLAEARAIAQKQFDADKQALLAAQAVVRAQQSQVELAQINLGYTSVRSLIRGIAGVATGQIGNLVGPTTILTTVSQVDPVKVYFGLGESEYLLFSQAISDAARGVVGPGIDRQQLRLILSDGSTYKLAGRLYLADREVNPQTGTIRVAATFPNPDGLLRPGQFGRVRVETQILKNALLIPQAAVNEIQGTYQVVVLGSGNRAEMRPVTVGPRVGTDWVIEVGLKPGEQVIVVGTQRVRAGLTVQPKPYQQPKN
jgi:RND family efflux transporter MFP subunit